MVIYRLPLTSVRRKGTDLPVVGVKLSIEEADEIDAEKEGFEPVRDESAGEDEEEVCIRVNNDACGYGIVRIPAEEVDRIERLSIFFPHRSFCPSCRTTIRWYDNIPILSYLMLRGRCRSCGWRIPVRYLVVELLAALLTAGTVIRFAEEGWAPTAVYVALVNTLIAVAFIDLEHFIIPNEISRTGIVLGLALSALVPSLHHRAGAFGFEISALVPSLYRGDTFGLGGRPGSLASSLLGAIVGGGIIYVVGVAGKVAFKKDAMGRGDVKLMAMVGAFIGWELVLMAIFFGSFFGSIVGLLLIAMGKADMQTKVPFGPYLALGAVVSLFFGNDLIVWYKGLLHGPM